MIISIRKTFIAAFVLLTSFHVHAQSEYEEWFSWGQSTDPKIQFRWGKYKYDETTASLLEFKSFYPYKIRVKYVVDKDSKTYAYGTVIEPNSSSGGLPGPSSQYSYKLLSLKASKYYVLGESAVTEDTSSETASEQVEYVQNHKSNNNSGQNQTNSTAYNLSAADKIYNKLEQDIASRQTSAQQLISSMEQGVAAWTLEEEKKLAKEETERQSKDRVDALARLKESIKMQANASAKSCNKCNGSGTESCSNCKGKGWDSCSYCTGRDWKICFQCGGNGFRNCSACDGCGLKIAFD